MTNYVLIGNITSAVGIIIQLIAASQKDSKKFLYLQGFGFAVYAVSFIVTGNIIGGIVTFTSSIKNVIVAKEKMNGKIAIGFGLFYAISTALTWDNRMVSLLPLIACIQYLVLTYLGKKRPVLIKVGSAIAQSCWCIYDINAKLYLLALADLFITIITVVNIIRTKEEKICN